MHVTRLRLTNFKRHRELDVELKPGVNVIRGPNEAGKSTTQRALELALFRRPNSSSQDVDDARPWGVPDADPIVEIEFEDGGTTGSLRKEFAGSNGSVAFRFDDEELTDPAAVEQRVAELTGLPSEKFFRATASIHQQELGGLDHDENTLRDRLQQSMTGADRGTLAARKKLEEAIRRYRSEGAKNPGYLKVHRTDVERLRAQATAGEQALVGLEADRRALAAARSERAKLETQLSEQQSGVAKAERATALATRAEDANARYQHYRKAAELTERVTSLEASHPTQIEIPALRSSVEQLRDLEFKLSEMRAELAAEPDLSGYDVAIPTPRWQPWAGLGVALIVASLAVAGIGVVAGLGVIGLVVGVALAVAGGGALFQMYRKRRLLTDVRMQNELRESEIARRLSGRTDLAERVRQGEQRRTDELNTIGRPDVAGAEALLAAETDHTAQIANVRSELRGLLGENPPPEDLVGKRDEFAAVADESRHALAGMGDIGREPQKYLVAFQRSVERLVPERETAIQAEANAAAKVDANETDAEKVAADVEALAGAEEALAAAERRVRIYEDVLTTLDKAERATMKKAARYLETRMATDIARITDGRYRRLRVDEETLTFALYSPELDEWTDARKLSQGTLDQLYLCARLGIVGQVTQPAFPPLVLDDPFVTFDDERATRAVELLKEVAADYQVILLTTSDRFDATADNVIVLPAPTARDDYQPPVADKSAEALSMWSSTTMPATTTMPAAAAPNGNGNGHGRAASEPARAAAPVTSTPKAEAAPLWPEER